MLVLARYAGEKVYIGDNITVEVLEVFEDGKVRLGFTAPRSIQILRDDAINIRPPRPSPKENWPRR